MESLFINSLTFVVITCLLCEGTVSLDNQFCRARPTLVALDHPTYSVFPYFVMLHRCGGSSGTLRPTIRECVATEYNEVDIIVYYIHSTGQQNTIKQRNHTKCGPSCVAKPEDCNPKYQRWDEENCKCECMFNNSDPPTGSCPVDHKWGRSACECECAKAPETCGMSEKWSKEACACVPDCSKSSKAKRCQRKGKVFDPKTCSCSENTVPVTVQVQPDIGLRPSDTGNSRTNLFTGLLVGESFVLIILCVVLIYTRCNSRRSKECPSTDYLKSPITGSSESLHFPDRTERKTNDCATIEVTMVSESDFVTRKI